MAKTLKPAPKAKKAPAEKKTANKKQVSEKSAKNINEVVIQPEPEQTHGIDLVVEVPPIPEKVVNESSEVTISEDGLIINYTPEDLSGVPSSAKVFTLGITHTKEDLKDGDRETGMCRVTYSDGSVQTMTLAEYQELPGILPLPVKTVQLTKSKEEMDEEAHWMQMGQIDHYINNIKGKN